jgi:hypothetical protein
MSKEQTVTELLTTLGFVPARVVVAEKLYREVREACVKVVHLGDTAIQLRAHPSLPDDMMIVFGAEGSFEVIRLEVEES